MYIKHSSLHFGAAAKGFISILDRKRGRATSCPVRELAETLSKNSGEDLYFSFNTFAQPSHCADLVWQYSAVYVGLDLRQVGLDPTDVLTDFKRFYFGSAMMPAPSYVLHSGNGLWLVWLIHPVTRRFRTRWEAVQAHFRSFFSIWPTDPNDAAKFIRVAGSHNSSAKREVELEVLNGRRYELDELFAFISEQDQAKVHNWEKVAIQRRQRLVDKRERSKRPNNVGQMLAARLRDLGRLVELRRHVSNGFRNHLMTIWTSTKFSLCRDVEETLTQALALNEEFRVPLAPSQVKAIVQHVSRRVYRWTTTTIMERLQMTPAECNAMEALTQQHVTVTLTAADRGLTKRQLQSQETVERVLAAKALGERSNRQIARDLGISEGTVRRALRIVSEVRNE